MNVKGSSVVVVLCGAWLAASPVLAQGRPAEAAERPSPAIQARHEIFVMERVLEQKVQLGAQMLSEQFREAGLPDVLLFAGAARARGVRLDGYGVFFDLDVPVVRLSMAWSLRVMDQPDPDVAEALGRLRELRPTLGDPSLQARLDGALRAIETRLGGARKVTAAPGISLGSNLTSFSVGPTRPHVIEDPDAVYTGEVRKAVIDAMFDHSGPMNLAPGDWLAVAAREDLAPRFLAGDPNDMPRTMILRVRGSDVAAFREGRLSREDAVARVEVKDD